MRRDFLRESLSPRELFLEFWAWQLNFKDLDPALWALNYLHNRYEHTVEEKLWMAFLYGNTYYLPTAWVIKNEFPDFRRVGMKRLEDWNSQNYSRLRYQTDCKWSKGHLPRMFSSYKDWVGNRSQKEAHFDTLAAQSDTAPFEVMSKEIKKKWFKFGRYSLWFYLQAVHRTCNLGVDYTPQSLLLSDYSGSKSHRNGLILTLPFSDNRREEWQSKKLEKDQYDYLESYGKSLLEEMKHRGYDTDFFDMETSLCAFKKIWRKNRGRYLGYYLDRQSEEIQKVEEDGWAGIKWDVLWQARQETLDSRLSGRSSVNKEMMATFLDTGKLQRLNWEKLND